MENRVQDTVVSRAAGSLLGQHGVENVEDDLHERFESQYQKTDSRNTQKERQRESEADQKVEDRGGHSKQPQKQVRQERIFARSAESSSSTGEPTTTWQSTCFSQQSEISLFRQGK